MQFNVNDDYKFAKEITSSELNEAHANICDGLKALRLKKGHDYGNVFEQTIGDYGLISPIVRFRDKLGRLENLLKVRDAAVEDESIRDTILDLGNYCILTCAVLDLIQCKKRESQTSDASPEHEKPISNNHNNASVILEYKGQ